VMMKCCVNFSRYLHFLSINEIQVKISNECVRVKFCIPLFTLNCFDLLEDSVNLN